MIRVAIRLWIGFAVVFEIIPGYLFVQHVSKNSIELADIWILLGAPLTVPLLQVLLAAECVDWEAATKVKQSRVVAVGAVLGLVSILCVAAFYAIAVYVVVPYIGVDLDAVYTAVILFFGMVGLPSIILGLCKSRIVWGQE